MKPFEVFIVLVFLMLMMLGLGAVSAHGQTIGGVTEAQQLTITPDATLVLQNPVAGITSIGWKVWSITDNQFIPGADHEDREAPFEYPHSKLAAVADGTEVIVMCWQGTPVGSQQVNTPRFIVRHASLPTPDEPESEPPDEVPVPDPVTIMQDDRLAIQFHYRARTPAEVETALHQKDNPDEKVAVFAFDKLSVSVAPGTFAAIEARLDQIQAKLDALVAQQPSSPSNPAPPPEDILEGLFPPINLNTAAKEELIRLKGIGDKRADSILALRQLNGGVFNSPFELTTVRGITAAMVQEWIDSGLLDLSVFPQP